MRIGIFTVHHKPGMITPVNNMFVPFMVGCTQAPLPPFIGDHAGSSLGALGHPSGSYGDLRAQFSVWKNYVSNYDVIGFQQYRRLFFFDTPKMREKFPETEVMTRAFLRHPSVFINAGTNAFTRYVKAMEEASSEIKSYIEDRVTSSIFVNRRLLSLETMSNLFKHCHDESHWDVLLSILNNRGTKYEAMANDASLNKWAPYCNMFVVKTNVFIDIISDIFDIMFEFERKIDLKKDGIEERAIAYVAERLMAMMLIDYIVTNTQISLIDLPVMNWMTEKEDGIFLSMGRIV